MPQPTTQIRGCCSVGEVAMNVTATPKLDRTIQLRDGRTIGYAEWGDLRGRPVVLFHGSPGSRLFCPDEDATEQAGVRLITIDRSGYGRSDPRPDPTVLGWARDYAEFVDKIELPPCPIVGWSRGGPDALAAAFGAPDHVTSVGLAAANGPLRFVPGDWAASPTSLRWIEQLVNDRAAAIAAITDDCAWFADDSDSWSAGMTDPGDPDVELIARPEVLHAMNSWFAEGARQGSIGMVGDDVALLDPWGFSVADVRQPVHIWWGDADRLVATCYADYFAATIPDAHLTIYAGEGHLFPISHWGEMLADLAELALHDPARALVVDPAGDAGCGRSRRAPAPAEHEPPGGVSGRSRGPITGGPWPRAERG
jgi:pimeloyl-ACP methyl ester carboxylesterase